jgi:hypothetical protein
VISPAGTFALGGQVLVGAAMLAGRRVGIRIEPTTRLLFDLDTRTVLRTRPNPLTAEQVLRLRGARPAGPPPRPALEPVRVRRLVDHRNSLGLRPTRQPRPRPRPPHPHDCCVRYDLSSG